MTRHKYFSELWVLEEVSDSEESVSENHTSAESDTEQSDDDTTADIEQTISAAQYKRW